MIILGLTGSIGMGKSTTAQMFRDHGIAVHDADATVHKLYSGVAVPLIEAAFPGTTDENGVDRTKLASVVIGDEAKMNQLEAIVHPLVREKELAFLKTAKSTNAELVVLDIPLLFETGGNERVDGVVVVTAPSAVQRQRVLERGGMNEEKFEKILSRQYPDKDKCRRADFVLDTSLGMNHVRTEVGAIIDEVRSGNWSSGSKK